MISNRGLPEQMFGFVIIVPSEFAVSSFHTKNVFKIALHSGAVVIQNKWNVRS